MEKEELQLSLSFKQLQAVNEMAKLMYDFLPGNPHPYANQSISFKGIAHEQGLGSYWPGGSKLPAITCLLEKTLEYNRSKFCSLILDVVRKAYQYRSRKNPLTRDEIEQLNKLILQVEFKIPELWDSDFLNSLPGSQQKVKSIDLGGLNEEFKTLLNLPAQSRGFAFEKFLNELFACFDMNPQKAFRITGEQIDGSFMLDGNTYLLEARWRNERANQADLLVFRGKIEGKSTWARGLFIAYNDFSPDGLEAFSKGKATNMIGMTGLEIYEILQGKIRFDDAIRLKTRKAAETGEFFFSVANIC